MLFWYFFTIYTTKFVSVFYEEVIFGATTQEKTQLFNFADEENISWSSKFNAEYRKINFQLMSKL